LSRRPFAAGYSGGSKDVVSFAKGALGERYVESFNGKLRDELLNRELFLSLDKRGGWSILALGLQPPADA